MIIICSCLNFTIFRWNTSEFQPWGIGSQAYIGPNVLHLAGFIPIKVKTKEPIFFQALVKMENGQNYKGQFVMDLFGHNFLLFAESF